MTEKPIEDGFVVGRTDFDFNLNDPPDEEENYEIFESENDFGSLESIFKPFVGQCFMSEEEAFIFYRKYAESSGFAIRKGRFISKQGEKKRRDFFCHCECKPDLKIVDPSKEQQDKKSLRCEFKAHMRIKLKKSFDIFPEEWQVTKFVEEPSHSLLVPDQVRFLAPYCTIMTEDETRIVLLKEGGLTVRLIMRVMEPEKNVKHEHLPFLVKDIHNFYGKLKKLHAKSDAMDLLQHCKNAKDENSNFQYSFTLDEERKLEHIFWSLAPCFEWYQRYGDVIVFDTTYKINSYEMPLGVFVGVDNNGRTILLGCALLHNETTNAFRWLMKTFVDLMGKLPKTILTDQDLWMTSAIAKEMPFTKHGYCIWHITSKFSGWFTSVLRNQYSSWCLDFYRLYRLDTPEEFERQWSLTIAKYNMETNKHVKGLYDIKYFWVSAYLHSYFFGGMTTTRRSESINAFIKRFISSHSSLCQLVKQIDLVVEDIRQTQLHDSMLETYRGSYLRTMSPLEDQAHKVLTPFSFKIFQEQFGLATQYMVFEENHVEFKVKHHKALHGQEHKVFWDGEITTCGCKFFEFQGILCRHVLSVFLHKDCFEIPSIYFLPRWCHEELQYVEDFINSEKEESKGTNPIKENVELVHCPPISKTKGCPKQKRMKGGKELAKQVKTCSLCRCPGHNISTCPENENKDVLNSAHKRKKVASEEGDLNPVFAMKC